MTDEQLLVQYRDTNNDSYFDEIVQRYQPTLTNYLRTHVGEHAEDLAQEAFLKIHEKRFDFDSDRRFKPWLFTIAQNKARDLHRRWAAKPTVPLRTDVPIPERSIDFLEVEHLREQIDLLPEKARYVLLQLYFTPHNQPTLAKELNIPVGTVKSRVGLAMEKLRAHYLTTTKLQHSI